MAVGDLGTFKHWQPLYARHNVPTFPCDGTRKKPMVRGWNKIGLPASAELADKYRNASSFGFVCGPRSRITILDVDSEDENVLREAGRTFGWSPIIWRTGSGNYAMPFRYNGEKRLVRPIEGIDVDILGGGFALAPPSLGGKGVYRLLRGDLDDLDHLPPLRGLDRIARSVEASKEIVHHGRRDNWLFRRLLREARYCDDLDALFDVGRTLEHEPLQSSATRW